MNASIAVPQLIIGKEILYLSQIYVRIIMTSLKALRIPSLFTLSFFSFAIAIFFLNTDCFSAQIKVAWSPNIEKDVAGYKIYYGNSSRNYHKSIDVGSRTSYTISDLIEGTTYFIGITAYDFNGNESAYSNEISHVASTPVTTSPLIPLEAELKTANTESTNGGIVYATKHSRFVHLPHCEKLISNTERKTIESETVQTSNSKIDALNNQITQLEVQITQLRAKYFDEHPQIKQRKNQMVRLKKLIEEESIKKVSEDNIAKLPGSENMLDSENVIKFPSLEDALKDGGIACPVCKP